MGCNSSQHVASSGATQQHKADVLFNVDTTHHGGDSWGRAVGGETVANTFHNNNHHHNHGVVRTINDVCKPPRASACGRPDAEVGNVNNADQTDNSFALIMASVNDSTLARRRSVSAHTGASPPTQLTTAPLSGVSMTANGVDTVATSPVVVCAALVDAASANGVCTAYCTDDDGNDDGVEGVHHDDDQDFHNYDQGAVDFHVQTPYGDDASPSHQWCQGYPAPVTQGSLDDELLPYQNMVDGGYGSVHEMPVTLPMDVGPPSLPMGDACNTRNNNNNNNNNGAMPPLVAAAVEINAASLDSPMSPSGNPLPAPPTSATVAAPMVWNAATGRRGRTRRPPFAGDGTDAAHDARRECDAPPPMLAADVLAPSPPPVSGVCDFDTTGGGGNGDPAAGEFVVPHARGVRRRYLSRGSTSTSTSSAVGC